MTNEKPPGGLLLLTRSENEAGSADTFEARATTSTTDSSPLKIQENKHHRNDDGVVEMEDVLTGEVAPREGDRQSQ